MTAARAAAIGALLAALALPWALQAAGADFYLGVASRILIYAVAATSLNLLLGYGGMISLGHAAFFGLGAYASAILLSEGVRSAPVHLLVIAVAVGVVALAIGAVSLRTRGVYFIMITLAFAQMLFYLANSMKGYGGDEGLAVRTRVLLPGGFDLHQPATLYYCALAVLVLVMLLLHRFSGSRFGRAVQALRDDEVRAEAIGLPVFASKLVVFVVAGVLCGVAGGLSANLQGYVSPNLLHWTQSGTLLVMVILGGVGTLWGGVLGAVALLLMQELLSAHTEYHEFWIGWVLLAVVLFARHGLGGALASLAGRRTAR
ncbi:branched-chain amino acid ABC transporter permease [Caenimonas terrae]|uniref:Branched-chain amino acid ABC transporter permease n=1 Tax=Caenimonas terrae TaxID=696074 RepID=A0ABW0NAP0_9BURK